MDIMDDAWISLAVKAASWLDTQEIYFVFPG